MRARRANFERLQHRGLSLHYREFQNPGSILLNHLPLLQLLHPDEKYPDPNGLPYSGSGMHVGPQSMTTGAQQAGWQQFVDWHPVAKRKRPRDEKVSASFFMVSILSE